MRPLGRPPARRPAVQAARASRVAQPARAPAAAPAASRRRQDLRGSGAAALGRRAAWWWSACPPAGRARWKTSCPALPADFPWPVLVAQHMPGNFTDTFARRMDSLCALTRASKCNATLPLEPGHATSARAAPTWWSSSALGRLAVQPRPETPGHPWHPSVEVLVDSAMKLLPAEQHRRRAAHRHGQRRRARHGAAQEARRPHHRRVRVDTAVVFGMPQELIETGGASLVLPCGEVSRQLCHWLHQEQLERHTAMALRKSRHDRPAARSGGARAPARPAPACSRS